MKRITCLLLFLPILSVGQINYGTPKEDQLPEKLKSLPRVMVVHHFPEKVDPIKIGDTYHWKHNTAVMCPASDITIIEFGAYIYYNDQWNLRVEHTPKEMDTFFGTKKQKMNHAEPYTWTQNWRTGPDLFGGWALWYFIGKMANGEIVCGYQSLETTSNLLHP